MTRLPTGEFRGMGSGYVGVRTGNVASGYVGVRTGNVYDQGYG